MKYKSNMKSDDVGAIGCLIFSAILTFLIFAILAGIAYKLFMCNC